MVDSVRRGRLDRGMKATLHSLFVCLLMVGGEKQQVRVHYESRQFPLRTYRFFCL